jgi:hypothetical protein
VKRYGTTVSRTLPVLAPLRFALAPQSTVENRQSKILYNQVVPETKPFRLTESVKAAG